jgi:hypothetical protein
MSGSGAGSLKIVKWTSAIMFTPVSKVHQGTGMNEKIQGPYQKFCI